MVDPEERKVRSSLVASRKMLEAVNQNVFNAIEYLGHNHPFNNIDTHLERAIWELDALIDDEDWEQFWSEDLVDEVRHSRPMSTNMTATAYRNNRSSRGV